MQFDVGYFNFAFQNKRYERQKNKPSTIVIGVMDFHPPEHVIAGYAPVFKSHIYGPIDGTKGSRTSGAGVWHYSGNSNTHGTIIADLKEQTE